MSYKWPRVLLNASLPKCHEEVGYGPHLDRQVRELTLWLKLPRFGRERLCMKWAHTSRGSFSEVGVISADLCRFVFTLPSIY